MACRLSRWTRAVRAIGFLGIPLVAMMSLILGVVVVLAPSSTSPSLAATTSGCLPQPPAAVAHIHLDGEQRRVVRTIVTVGRGLRVPPHGWVVAVVTALQESGLRPLPYGDRDSLGVFQQRADWGSTTQRMSPRTAAHMFFAGGQAGQRGLLDISGWQHLSVTRAAQAVQHSAYPDAYAKWEPLAVKLVRAATHVDLGCTPHSGWVFPLGNAPKVLTAGFGNCGGGLTPDLGHAESSMVLGKREDAVHGQEELHRRLPSAGR